MTVHEHHGERRRVLRQGTEGVTFDRPDAPHLPAETVSRGAWLEWTSPGPAFDFDGKPMRRKRPAAPVTDRDVKPHNIMLSEKPAAALEALAHDARDGGWTRGSPHELRSLAGGLSHGGWQRAVKALVDLELVERRERGARTGDAYRLTDLGRRVAAARGPHERSVGRMVQPTWPHGGPHGTPDDDVSFGSMSFKDKKKEPDTSSSTAEGAAHAGPHGIADLGRMDHALLVQALQWARLVASVIEAALGAAHPPPVPQAAPPGPAPVGLANEHGDAPCEVCHAQTVRRRNPEGDRPFIGCSRFPACKETRSIRDPHAPPKRRRSKHAWAPGLEAALEQRRRENAQPVGMRDSVAELLGHAPRDAQEASAWRRCPATRP